MNQLTYPLFRVCRIVTSMLLLCSIGHNAMAQETDKRKEKADKYYLEGSYQRAIPYYQKILKKDFNVDVMRSLAECYRQTRDFPEAAKWYGYVVNTQHGLGDDHGHTQ